MAAIVYWALAVCRYCQTSAVCTLAQLITGLLQCPWHCDLCLGKQRHRRVKLARAPSQYWEKLGLNPLPSSVCGRSCSHGESRQTCVVPPTSHGTARRGKGLVSEGWARRVRRACWASGGTWGRQGGLPSMGSHSQTRLKRLSSSSSRDKVGFCCCCCLPYCWPLTRFIPAPRLQSCICEKGLLIQPQSGKAGRGEGIPVLFLVTRVTRLHFSGLQFVRWRLQYYLAGVVLMRTGLDINTAKAHS